MSLISKASRLLTRSGKPLTGFIQCQNYANKNILRNRYRYRNKDGSFRVFNETVDIVPEEFQAQDEYSDEKRLAAFYQRKHTERSKSREKDFGVRVPTEKIQEELERVELGESAPSITCKKRFQDLERGIVDFDEEESDMPVNLRSDPFGKNIHKCVFCKYDIPLDYKNTQLLSQFVSQHTGIVYSQEVTGLCIYKYREVESMIVRARKVGIMPFFYKETTFLGDPELFDPYRNNLKSVPNNYDKRKLNADPAVVEDKKPPQSGL